jgi:hypothetical protein
MMHIDGLKIIQVNTDGMTVRVPRANKWLVDTARAAWESRTGLQLEEAIYKRMFILNVNNYLAEYEE